MAERHLWKKLIKNLVFVFYCEATYLGSPGCPSERKFSAYIQVVNLYESKIWSIHDIRNKLAKENWKRGLFRHNEYFRGKPKQNSWGYVSRMTWITAPEEDGVGNLTDTGVYQVACHHSTVCVKQQKNWLWEAKKLFPLDFIKTHRHIQRVYAQCKRTFTVSYGDFSNSC